MQLLYGAMEVLERRLTDHCHQVLGTKWRGHPDRRQAERPIDGNLQWVALLRHRIEKLYGTISRQVE